MFHLVVKYEMVQLQHKCNTFHLVSAMSENCSHYPSPLIGPHLAATCRHTLPLVGADGGWCGCSEPELCWSQQLWPGQRRSKISIGVSSDGDCQLSYWLPQCASWRLPVSAPCHLAVFARSASQLYHRSQYRVIIIHFFISRVILDSNVQTHQF